MRSSGFGEGRGGRRRVSVRRSARARSFARSLSPKARSRYSPSPIPSLFPLHSQPEGEAAAAAAACLLALHYSSVPRSTYTHSPKDGRFSAAAARSLHAPLRRPTLRRRRLRGGDVWRRKEAGGRECERASEQEWVGPFEEGREDGCERASERETLRES